MTLREFHRLLLFDVARGALIGLVLGLAIVFGHP